MKKPWFMPEVGDHVLLNGECVFVGGKKSQGLGENFRCEVNVRMRDGSFKAVDYKAVDPAPYQRYEDGMRDNTIAHIIYFENKTETEAIKEYDWLNGYYNQLRNLTLRRICEKEGHKIEDTSEGTPDHGDISGHCTRCGWSFHHQLY